MRFIGQNSMDVRLASAVGLLNLNDESSVLELLQDTPRPLRSWWATTNTWGCSTARAWPFSVHARG
ncbi:hypothetical protein ACYT86_15760, partial [Pseudomonas idahonensis]